MPGFSRASGILRPSGAFGERRSRLLGQPTPRALPHGRGAPQRATAGPGRGRGRRRSLVNRQQVAFVREEWRVVDRWWTEEPLDRRYYEVVLESGQNVCVYRDRERGCWFTQRG